MDMDEFQREWVLRDNATYQTAYVDDDGVELAYTPKDIKDSVNPPSHYNEDKGIESDGGPSGYYDFPDIWRTWNDLADFKAKRQWKEHSFHLGNIGKALYRWGEKSGTTKNYDAKKIVYSGLRILLMLEGKENVRTYLKDLLNDRQFRD